MITRTAGQVGVHADNVYQAWVSALDAIINHGQLSKPRDQLSKELLGLQLRIRHSRNNIIADPARKLNYRFLVGQWLATMAGVEEKNLEPYNKAISQYETDGRGGTYPSYGPRLLPQWPYVLQQLTADNDTRQAVASIWEAQRLENERYVPCTLSLQFLLRKSYPGYPMTLEEAQKERPRQLHTVATMRSSDAWLGLPYDIFNFTMLANLLASALSHVQRDGIEAGEFILNLGSSHLYEQHFDLAAKIVADPKGSFISSPRLPPSISSPLAGLQQLLTRQPQPLEEKDWSWWPWPWKNYVAALTAASSADAFNMLFDLERRDG